MKFRKTAVFMTAICAVALIIGLGAVSSLYTYNGIVKALARIGAFMQGEPTIYNDDLTYNGMAQNLGKVIPGLGGGTVRYCLSSDGAYDTSIPTGTNAGSYTVFYKIAGISGRKEKSGRYVQVIKKADPTLTLSAYSGTLNYPKTGSFTYSYNGDGAITAVSTNTNTASANIDKVNEKVSISPKAVSDAASTDIVVSATAGQNYNAVSKTYTLTVTNSYTVTFDGNGGTPASTTKTYIYDAAIGSFPNATYDGYELTGWYTAASGGTAVNTDTNITADAIYYAQWKKAKPTITEFTTGIDFNNKIKLLAQKKGGSYSQSSIKNITYSNSFPADLTDAVELQSSDSDGKIYGTFDESTGTLAIYAEPEKSEENAKASPCLPFLNADAGSMFQLCNLTGTIQWPFNTSRTTNMMAMFGGCNNVATLNLAGWDTSNVTNIQGMFEEDYKLSTVNLTGWDTSKVTHMSRMFYDCNALTTVYASESFKTNNVISSTNVFYGTTNLVGGEGTAFTYKYDGKDYAHVDGGTDNPGYFTLTTATIDKAKLQNIAKNGTFSSSMSTPFSFERVYTAPPSTITSGTNYEIQTTDSKLKIYAWIDSDSVMKVYSEASVIYLPEDSSRLFQYWHHVNATDSSNQTFIDLTGFDTSKVTNMSSMFEESLAVKYINLTGCDTSNVTNMQDMFSNCTSVQSITLSEKFSTSKVTNMKDMFWDCHYLENIDEIILRLDTSNVTTMYGMFYHCFCEKASNVDLSSFDTSKVTDMGYMFVDCQKMQTINISNWNTSNLQDVHSMFSGCKELNTIDLSKLDFSSVQNASEMFYVCSTLQSVMLPKTTGSVATMQSMFFDCTSLQTIDLSGIDTSNLRTVSNMFSGCTALKTADISGWNTSNVTTFTAMFSRCTNLETIYATSSIDLSSAKYKSNVFTSDTKLVGGEGTKYNQYRVDTTYARLDDADSGNPGYFTMKPTSFQIKFDANGGSGQMADQTFTETDKKTLDSNAFLPAESSNVFIGWNTKSDGSGRWIEDNAVMYCHKALLDVPDKQNVLTLYAQWADSDAVKYTSHTSNINKYGIASSMYGDNLDTNDVVSIDGAAKLHVKLYFSVESNTGTYDWLCVWQGAHPDYKASSSTYYNKAECSFAGKKGKIYSDYSHMNKTQMADAQILEGDIDGDSVTFGFKSDSSTGYYGYYAVITDASNTASSKALTIYGTWDD